MATTLEGKVRGTPSFELFAGDVARKRYVHTYQIRSDDPANDDESVVAATSGLDDLADAYSVDGAASLKNIRFRQDSLVSAIWYAELEYDSEINATQGGGGGGGGVAPVDLSPEIEYDYETLERISQKDAFGKPYTTSAGEPFEGGVVLTDAITILTYSRWQSAFNSGFYLAYMNKVNHAPFSGANAFEVLMSGVRARLRPIAGTKLWWVTFVMKYNPKSWQLFLRDVGHFSGSLAAPVYPRVASARGRTTLIALDGGGGASLTGNPATLTFNPHLIANFNLLGL